MATEAALRTTLVMGVGNTLLQDDGVGVHVISALAEAARNGFPSLDGGVELVDAGTLGLALLPKLEAADEVIVVDASELGVPPGTLHVFRGREIDEMLSRRRRSVHEVALLDLFAAAALRGCCPPRRALVAIQPGSTDWGLEPTAPVAAAIPVACETVLELIDHWRLPEPQVA